MDTYIDLVQVYFISLHVENTLATFYFYEIEMKLLTEIDKIKLLNEFRISKEPAGGSLQIQPSDTPDDLSSLDYRTGAKM